MIKYSDIYFSFLQKLPWRSWLPDENTHLLIRSVYSLLVLMLILLFYILIAIAVKTNREKQEKKYKRITDLIIQITLFSDQQNRDVRIPFGVQKLLKRPFFRSFLITELVTAKRSFSGDAAVNLQAFYKKCKLYTDSLRKLKSFYWYLRAQGIQELAEMGQDEYFEKLFKFTNDQNQQIRIEAQNAVVKFSGFSGLTFLDFLSYPLSDWQQIKLITELQNAQDDSSSYIKGWLSSPNYSVIIFSLKLTAIYHHFELHQKVLHCLYHPSYEVRFHAISTLKEIYNEYTPAQLVEAYRKETVRNKIAILEVLRVIANENELAFLMQEFEHENHDIKLVAGRAVATVKGVEFLESSSVSKTHPWNNIIAQIKEETTA